MGTGITTRDLFVLDQACEIINRAFGGHRCYLVGSAFEAKESPRDVDVRVILDDDEFDRLFKGKTRTDKFGSHNSWRIDLWQMMCLTTAEYLRSVTGLPIDFQIQKQSIANEKHNKPRNPLGLGRGRVYAGGGDGTGFWT